MSCGANRPLAPIYDTSNRCASTARCGNHSDDRVWRPSGRSTRATAVLAQSSSNHPRAKGTNATAGRETIKLLNPPRVEERCPQLSDQLSSNSRRRNSSRACAVLPRTVSRSPVRRCPGRYRQQKLWDWRVSAGLGNRLSRSCGSGAAQQDSATTLSATAAILFAAATRLLSCDERVDEGEIRRRCVSNRSAPGGIRAESPSGNRAALENGRNCLRHCAQAE